MNSPSHKLLLKDSEVMSHLKLNTLVSSGTTLFPPAPFNPRHSSLVLVKAREDEASNQSIRPRTGVSKKGTTASNWALSYRVCLGPTSEQAVRQTNLRLFQKWSLNPQLVMRHFLLCANMQATPTVGGSWGRIVVWTQVRQVVTCIKHDDQRRNCCQDTDHFL